MPQIERSADQDILAFCSALEGASLEQSENAACLHQMFDSVAAQQHGSRNLVFEIQEELARASPRVFPHLGRVQLDDDVDAQDAQDDSSHMNLEFLVKQLHQQIAQNKYLTEKSRCNDHG